MDAMALPANRHCSIARALGVLGQKWNLLLLREAFFGRTRFAEFAQIGIPTGTLGARLDALVEAGLLERRAYQEAGERARDEYVLSDAGRDTLGIVAALLEWGDEHRPLRSGPSTRLTTLDGRPVRLAFVDDDDALVARDDITVARNPVTA